MADVKPEKKTRSLVLIDKANLHYGFKKLGWDFDYRNFHEWLQKTLNPIAVYCYDGIISKKAFFDVTPTGTIEDFMDKKGKKEMFFKFLRGVGYIVESKPIACIYDNTAGKNIRKCNFDVEMTITAVDRLEEYDQLVLCSGDGDFVKLLKYVKTHYKKTIIIAIRDRLNWQLKKTANQTIFLEDLRKTL